MKENNKKNCFVFKLGWKIDEKLIFFYFRMQNIENLGADLISCHTLFKMMICYNKIKHFIVYTNL